MTWQLHPLLLLLLLLVLLLLHFNERFTDASSSQFSFLTSGRKPLGISFAFLVGQMPFLLPNQQCPMSER